MFEKDRAPSVIPGIIHHMRTKMIIGSKKPGSALWYERMGHPGLAVKDKMIRDFDEKISHSDTPD